MLLITLALLTPSTTPARVVAPPAGCVVMGMKTAGRKSPLDSLSFKVGASEVKVCYGRPSARGRTMIGGENVPFGKLWRTGANEPTMIHTSGPLVLAGVKVAAGSYSLYSVPGEKSWEIIVNRSVTQWGEESNYTDKVKAQEVGHGTVPVTPTKAPVETFTITAEPAALVLEWEKTRVAIPISDK